MNSISLFLVSNSFMVCTSCSDSLMMPPSPPKAAAEADEDGDGWGDMDDDLDADADAEAERQARSRLSKLSTGGTTGRVASNGSLGGGASSDGWGDDDDDALFSGVAAATNQMSNQSRPTTRPTMATRTVGGHVALGGGTRGVPRGNKPAPMKLGAKKLNAKDIDLESMLN